MRCAVRQYVHRLLLAAALLVLTGCSRRQPDLLLITLDTTRADRLGCYGYEPARTPVLDRLAAEGILYKHCVTVAPLTLPAHTSMLTGLHPRRHGLHTNGRGALAPDLPLLQEHLRQAGYQTGAFVASVVLDRRYGLARGFDHYDDELLADNEAVAAMAPGLRGLFSSEAYQAQRPANRVVDAALQWLGRQSRRAPVFVWLHFFDPHHPYQDRSRELGHAFAEAYDSELAYVDRELGRFLAERDRVRPRRARSILVIGDHGESLGEHGEPAHGLTLYQGAMHVPLILAGADIPSLPDPVGGLTSVLDVYPTLLNLAGLWPPDGTASVGRYRGLRLPQDAPPADRRLAGATDIPYLDYGWAPVRCLWREDWKYIESPRPELYNLTEDPHEQKNLIHTAGHVATLLAGELAEHLAQLQPLADMQAVHLSAADRRALESLGYLAGSGDAMPAALPEAAMTGLRDIKDVLPEPYGAYLRLREHVMTGGDVAAAIGQARQLVAEVPETAVFHGMLGQLQLHGGAVAAALETYAAATNRFPLHSGLQTDFAAALLAAGRHSEAAALAGRLYQTEPDNEPALMIFSRAQRLLGRPVDAVSALTAALARGLVSAGIHAELGAAYAVQGQTKFALHALEQSLSAATYSESETVLLFGRLVAEQQDSARLPQAMRLVWTQYDAAPQDPRPGRVMAALLASAGRFARAVEILDDVLTVAQIDAATRERVLQERAGYAQRQEAQASVAGDYSVEPVKAR